MDVKFLPRKSNLPIFANICSIQVRQKQRDNAIRAAKDKKKASEANKKANRAANKAANKAQAPKGGNKGRVPMKGGAKGGKR